MTTDPNIVRRAPNVAVLVGGAVTSQHGLSDRARGVMLGLAVGNLLGLPMEGDSYRHIQRAYPNGVRDIDPGKRTVPWTMTSPKLWSWARPWWTGATT